MAGQVSGCRTRVRYGCVLARVQGALDAFGHATGLLPGVGSRVLLSRSWGCQLLYLMWLLVAGERRQCCATGAGMQI